MQQVSAASSNSTRNEDTKEQGDKSYVGSEDYRESDDEDYVAKTNEHESGSESDSERENNTSEYNSVQGAGLVKTRAQRQKETHEENPVLDIKASIVDVDSIWNELKTVGHSTTKPRTDDRTVPAEEYVTIERTYEFSGEVVREKKQVLASSAEAKTFFSNQKDKSRTSKRNPKRARKSRLLDELEQGKAKKISTLEKSRLDWAGFVDSEGIKDDLKRNNENGYIQRQEFLGRVDYNLDKARRGVQS